MVMLKRSHNIGKFLIFYTMGFPGGSDGKESACNERDPGFIRGSGRSLGEGNGNSLQYSYLENPMNKEAGCSPQGHKSLTQLSDFPL